MNECGRWDYFEEQVNILTSEKKAGRSRMFDSFADRKLIVTRSLPSISNEIDKKNNKQNVDTSITRWKGS